MAITVGTTKSTGKLSFAHTVDVGTTMLVVNAAWYTSTDSITGISWSLGGGEALTHVVTEIGGGTNTNAATLWYRANPTAGAGTISITFDSNPDEGPASCAINLLGTATTSPIDNTDDGYCEQANCLASVQVTPGATYMTVGAGYSYESPPGFVWDQLTEQASTAQAGTADTCSGGIATKINESDADVTAEFTSAVAMVVKDAPAVEYIPQVMMVI